MAVAARPQVAEAAAAIRPESNSKQQCSAGRTEDPAVCMGGSGLEASAPLDCPSRLTKGAGCNQTRARQGRLLSGCQSVTLSNWTGPSLKGLVKLVSILNLAHFSALYLCQV